MFERKLKETESNMKADALYDSRNEKTKKYPLVFFLLSKTNIDVTMKLFVTKMKSNIYDIIQCPKQLDLIIDKRITHHVQVTQILFFVHVLSKNVSLTTFFETIDRVFVVSLF